MALNIISNLAPALLPIVLKLMESYLSNDGANTPAMREKRQSKMCRCQMQGPFSRPDVNQCSTCGMPYYPTNNSKKLYLNMPKNKIRSMSSSDSNCHRNKSENKCSRRERCSSDSYPKHITDHDTLRELGRRLETEAFKVGSKQKLSSLNHGEVERKFRKI